MILKNLIIVLNQAWIELIKSYWLHTQKLFGFIQDNEEICESIFLLNTAY